ncbi:MAG: hypothetical protein ACKPH7_27695 [Planktothrix sp.]|uniref:hypothetical protein n=1 Tax=Planktothrix sp. TaxID=3088171 RepID=UPI0038D4C4A2
MTAKKQSETNETTQNPDELLAIKLGFKLKNGKGDVKALKDTIFNIIQMNADNLNSVEQIDKAIKLYTSNGVAKRNQENSQKALQKIEDAINECLKNNTEPTKTYLNKRFGINYNLLKKYQEIYPDKLPR